MHGKGHLHIILGTMNCQFALQRLQLMKPVMGNFRGYISADGVWTMVLRGSAGLMVEICGKSCLYEPQNCWEIKMGPCILECKQLVGRKALQFARLFVCNPGIWL